MSLDAQSAALIEARRRAGIPPVATQTLAEIRGSRNAWRVATPVPKLEVYSIHEHAVAVAGGEILVRVYEPQPAADRRTAIVYFHGGGWVLGDLGHSDALCRYLCAHGGHVVINVDYRLAPEHRFPVAAEDCYAAFEWTGANADALRIDRRRIVVCGGSAGGNLTAVVCLMARDRSGLRPVAQILAYPVLDDNCSSISYRTYSEGYIVSTEDMRWYWRQYLGKVQGTHAFATPLKADDLMDLPPALVITAENDPVRDDGERYVMRLRQAGNQADLSRYAGTLHGFLAMPGALDKADDAVAEALGFIANLPRKES